LLVTIWELGEAAGPLFIAPLSEVYGRYPVFNIANICFIIGTLVAAASQSTLVFVFARFLTGCAVASNVLNPSIIGDMLPPEERGSPMSLIMLAPLMGGAVGPAIAGALAQTLGWRQVLCLAALIAIVCEFAFFTLLRETYKPRILQKRVKRIRRYSSNPETLALARSVMTGTGRTKSAIWESMKRPARVFYGSSVLQLLSLYGALEFSMFYVMSTSLPDILNDVYNFPPSLSGASFLCFSK
jgi:MFS family permease